MNLILHLCIYNLSKPYYHQGSKENYRKGDNDSVLYLLNVLARISEMIYRSIQNTAKKRHGH